MAKKPTTVLKKKVNMNACSIFCRAKPEPRESRRYIAFGFHFRVNFGINCDVGRSVLDGPVCACFKTMRDSTKLLNVSPMLLMHRACIIFR